MKAQDKIRNSIGYNSALCMDNEYVTPSQWGIVWQVGVGWAAPPSPPHPLQNAN